MRVAVIGMGSNSLRMLISDVFPTEHRLEQVLRARDALRVFASLSANNGGVVARDMIEHAASAIQNMKRIAQEMDAEKIYVFATSATRDCENKEEFIGYIESATKLSIDILSGNDEAKLSFLGATFGNTGGVIDIGGGSTEIAVGSRENLSISYSMQMGAVRLYRMSPIHTSKDIQSTVTLAKNIIKPHVDITKEQLEAYGIKQIFGVGGTFTSLSALVQNIPWNQYQSIHDYVLTKEKVWQKMLELADVSMQDRSKLASMQPSRADIIVNGIAILYACMDSFDIDSVRVSTKGNLEGYLIQKYL